MTILKSEWIRRAKGGNPYALLQLKEALLGLEADQGFRLYQEAHPPAAGAALAAVRAVSMQRAAASGALRYTETGAARVPFVNRAPRVLGDNDARDLQWQTRTAYVACFADCRMWSRAHAIEWNGQVLLDFEDWELAAIDDRLELDPLIFRSAGQGIHYMRHPPGTREAGLDRAFMLTGCHSKAFGHWMWQYLPKMLAAVETGLMPPMPVVIDEDMPPTHRQALAAMLPDGFSIHVLPSFASLRVKELWCAPTLFYQPQLAQTNDRYRSDILAGPAARFAPVLGRMGRSFGHLDRAGAEDRVYLTRRAGKRRRLVNGAEIEALARGRGFTVVDPEGLDFSEQARVIRNARQVIAPEGSAVFLMFLARPGSSLLILNHPFCEDQASFTALIEGIGIDTFMLTGPFEKRHPDWIHFSDYRIDPEAFAAALDRWLDRT